MSVVGVPSVCASSAGIVCRYGESFPWWGTKPMIKPKAPKPPLQAVAVTAVPTKLTSKPGELGTPTIEQVHRRVTDSLAKAEPDSFVGVIEVGLIEHQAGRYPSSWAWHLHGVALTRNPDAFAQCLREAFPK